MDFAKASSLRINGISFELWDFQLRNNFSPLWPKFISSSDLVILVFNLGNYHLKIIDHFINLQKLEGNFSKLIVIGNKRDLVEDDDIRRIKNELNIHNFVEISLNSPDAETKIKVLIKEIIGLKEDLPQNFEEMVQMADNLTQDGKKVQALAKYKELVKICTEYQDLEQERIFNSKVDEVNTEIREQTKLRREFEKKKDFAVPVRVKFEKKISVKPLPSTISVTLSVKGEKADDALLPTIETSPKKLVAFQEIEPKPNRLKIIKPTKIPYKAKKVSLPPRSESELKEKTVAKLPLELFPPHEDLVKEIEKPKIINFTDELQKIISEKGSSLSLKLSETLLADLEKSLGRQLTIDDVTSAAEFFVQQDQLLG
jgi:GTPase SAR1 family protein